MFYLTNQEDVVLLETHLETALKTDETKNHWIVGLLALSPLDKPSRPHHQKRVS